MESSFAIKMDGGSLKDGQPVEIDFLPAGSMPGLEAAWTDLQIRADGSFFLSWHWIGCWLDHLPDWARPHVLVAKRGGQVVGLAILCRRTVWRYGVVRTPSWLLHETGDRGIDNLTIEYNGILADRSCADEVTSACLLWMARNLPGCDELVLAGLDQRMEGAVRSLADQLGYRLQVRRSDSAKWVDLDAVRGRGGNYRAGLGKSSRAGVNRAIRLYEARGGIDFQVACDEQQALAFFDGLETLHRQVWAARGKTDAFSNPVFGSFHRELIRRGIDSGVVRICRAAAGGADFGYLYNFVWRGTVLNYQSGFAYESDNRLKPGLVSHVLAIEDALDRGEAVYDFMAGSSGHKAHLSNAQAPMNWVSIGPDRLARRVEAGLGRIDGSLRLLRRRLLKLRAASSNP
ncbi:GNAT family N-acetyltransferase [Skermanella pratensis]|uniref:GNAT family N-acetyltransferase n=1 Tax=Skermanella pratensis TaxID=2233999 RepID=UPI00130137E3|nr:GNAT family N-acetyltransferase [Skermanella pratensis]